MQPAWIRWWLQGLWGNCASTRAKCSDLCSKTQHGTRRVILNRYPGVWWRVCCSELYCILPVLCWSKSSLMFPMWRLKVKLPDQGHMGSLCWSSDPNCFPIGLVVMDGDEWEVCVLARSRQQAERKTSVCIMNKSCSSSWQPRERLKITLCACPSCFFSGKVWKLMVPKADSVIYVVFTSFVKHVITLALKMRKKVRKGKWQQSFPH